MMPAYCPDSAPPGERDVYAALAESSETRDWIVLHSLGIADHVRQVEGEADFVVIVPGAGVLVLEVKSHRSIDRRADGTWKLGNDAPTARGPFQQASEAMYSVREYLVKKHVDLRSIPVISAVWFTAIRARSMLPQCPEWHDWQVLDTEDLKASPVAVLRTLAAGGKHLEDKIKYFAYGGVGLGAQEADRIAGLLRPRFELATVAGDRRRARESDMVHFVEEQFQALDAASENHAVLFSGPAGSGKTFLAIESARREIAMGNRGRLICFNRFLGKRLARDLADLSGLTVGTLHQEMLRLAGFKQAPDHADSEFWYHELPEQAMEALVDGGDALVNDFLVVDEVQDVAREQYLHLLDLMVAGGLENGRLLFFGDFERQSIFENEAGRERLRAVTPHLAGFKLMQNCRNLPRIGYQVNLLSHLQPGYQHFRRLDDGIDPIFYQYQSGDDQSALLVAAIRNLKDEGYELNEIVVLSPSRDGSTAATTEDRWLRQILKPADGLPSRPGQVQYATIQAFKGLEAPAVVVTDLNQTGANDSFDALLYVGLTRATDRLIALIEAATLRHAIRRNP